MKVSSVISKITILSLVFLLFSCASHQRGPTSVSSGETYHEQRHAQMIDGLGSKIQ